MASWHQRYARMAEEQRPPSNAFTAPCHQCLRLGTRKRRTGDGRLVCEYRPDCLRAAIERRPTFGQVTR